MITPSLAEYAALSRDFNLIPVTREIPADLDTPVSAFRKLDRGDSSFLLESLEGGETWGRYSILGFRPSLEFRSKGNDVQVRRGRHTQKITSANPLGALQELLQESCAADVQGLPPFSGGAVGMIGYDTVRCLERLPTRLPDDLGHPDLYFVFPDLVLVFDSLRHRLHLVVNSRPDGQPERAYREAVAAIEEIIARLQGLAPASARALPVCSEVKFVSNVDKEPYKASVLRAREHIQAGNAVRITLAQRLEADAVVNPFDVYRVMRVSTPSPYLFFLKNSERSVAGSSSEMLVRVSGSEVTLRTISGTRQRGAGLAEDTALEKDLALSEKDHAEHVTLVDLARNDVGRIARIGSVRATSFMQVERCSQAMHLASQIEGELRSGLGAFDAVRACFPAGTVSGVPRKRAMELIEELESTRRGPYGGAVGYFDFRGSAEFCVSINTATFERGGIHCGVGAGIFADSDPDAKWAEARDKGFAVEEAVRLAARGVHS